MKLLLSFSLIAALSAFAQAPKATPETAPVLTAADREPLHEAEEMLQSDQTQAALGQAASDRLPARQKAVEAAGAVLKTKCGAYGIVRNEVGRLDCGKTKAVETAPAAKPAAK